MKIKACAIEQDGVKTLLSLHVISAAVVEVRLVLEPYKLYLRSNFGTSHSSTTTRSNALVTFSVAEEGSAAFEGYGEIGLPPKKPGVYEADYMDCEAFMVGYHKTLQQADDLDQCNPFYELQGDGIIKLRSDDSVLGNTLRILLAQLDNTADVQLSDGAKRAARSGIETAIMDCWGKIRSESIHSLFGGDSSPIPGFFTAALSNDISEIVKAAKFGSNHTRYLKIKLDKDVDKGIHILAALRDALNPQHEKTWAVDANTAWTPALAQEFLRKSKEFHHLIYMVEQPFAANVTRDVVDTEGWAAVKESYGKAGLMIYADESVKTHQDIASLVPLVHGVNVKMEKAGGYRGAVRALQTAKTAGLRTWIGVMVGSTLNSTATSELLPWATHGDLDGSLLVTKECEKFTGGFNWNSATGCIEPHSLYGLGVDRL